MNELLLGICCFIAGAACVGAWWWWLGHKARVRAIADAAQQGVQQISKKI